MNRIDLEKVKSIVKEIISSNTITDIVFVGCGASKADLYPGYYFLRDNSKKIRCAHYTANEFNYDTPLWLGETTVVISASLGGATPETINANTIAKEHKATVIGITKEKCAQLLKDADYSIVHTFDFKNEKMAYALALAMEFLKQIEGYKYYQEMTDGFNQIFSLCETGAKMVEDDAKQFALEHKSEKVIYVMSSGASNEVAYASSICLLLEMQWINSSSFHSGEYFHGPFEITDQDVPFILLMNDGNTRFLDTRAQTFLQRMESKTTIIDAKDYGLSSQISSDVVSYFNPLLHTAVFRVYAEELSYARKHPLTKRRYMWKLEY